MYPSRCVRLCHFRIASIRLVSYSLRMQNFLMASMLHAHAARHCCMPMLYAHAVCPSCLSMRHEMNFNFAYIRFA
jgi:hypothetical protein